MMFVPLQPLPNQAVSVALNNQPCQINVYQKFFGLFLDLYVSNTLVIGGVLCLNLNRVVRSAYLGFQGDLGFWDTQGSQDPYYTGVGSRYQLVYLTPADLASIGVPALGD